VYRLLRQTESMHGVVVHCFFMVRLCEILVILLLNRDCEGGALDHRSAVCGLFYLCLLFVPLYPRGKYKASYSHQNQDLDRSSNVIWGNELASPI